MLAQLALTFSQLFRVIGFFVLLWGVLLLLGAMFGVKGADGYFKAALFIFIGSWIGRFGA